MQSTPSPGEDGRVNGAVGFLPLKPGVQNTPSLREDGYDTNTVRILPREPGVQSTASLREDCLLYTSPSPRDATLSRMPSSA